MIFTQTRINHRVKKFNEKYAQNSYTQYRVSYSKFANLHTISFTDDTEHATITTLYIESDWRKKWKCKRITLYHEYSHLVNDIMYVIAPLVPPQDAEVVFMRNFRRK